jgi:hypothetical protein
MSLYNAICGFGKFAPLLLGVLNLGGPGQLLPPHVVPVPRFRDAYVDDEGKIVVLTRTGGSNRETHAEGNELLTKQPGYIRDEDDGFDNTFARFYFEVPAGAGLNMKRLRELQGPRGLSEFRRVVEDLANNKDTPETRRAIEVGKQIAAQLEAAIASNDTGVVFMKI